MPQPSESAGSSGAAAAAAPTPAASGVLIRPLALDDYDRNFLGLIGQLTTVGEFTRERFAEFFALRTAASVVTLVAEVDGRLLGTASLVLEPKFSRGGTLAGHIEDVVVDAAARGRRVGEALVKACCDIGRERRCYKVILDCTAENKAFYEKCGFAEKEVQMRLDL